jgi:hypothetical protein
VPDQLAERSISLTGETAGEVADAERAVGRINRDASGLADSEAIARLLLRAEAVASSRIEGLEVGGRRYSRPSLRSRSAASLPTSRPARCSTTSKRCAGPPTPSPRPT